MHNAYRDAHGAQVVSLARPLFLLLYWDGKRRKSGLASETRAQGLLTKLMIRESSIFRSSAKITSWDNSFLKASK